MTNSSLNFLKNTAFPVRCRKLVQRFAKDQSGAISVMFVLILPILFGVVGLGLDVGIWFKERRELQTLADTAAISAAIENKHGASNSELVASVVLEADRNGFDVTTDMITYVGAPSSGVYLNDPDYVEVIVTRQLDSYLSQVFYDTPPSTMARAVASTIANQEACILALDTTAPNSIYLNGAGTSVNLDNCSMASNSSDSEAVNVQNGDLNAECIWAVGAVAGTEKITTNCPEIKSNAAVTDDPLASLSVPTFDPVGCLSGVGVTAYTPSDGETLNEGVYCNGLTISSGRTVTMNDGIYIMDKGDFTVLAGGSVTSAGPDGVTIILTSSSGSGYGTININGGGNVDLQAQITDDTSGTITGEYIGVLFYQDRDAANSPSLELSVSGGSDVELTGIVYSPKNDLSFSGGSTALSNGCLMLIAQNVEFNGSADLDNDCSMFGGNPIKFGSKPTLVE